MSAQNPDEEAMLLVMKVVERARVAKSVAKITAGLVTAGARDATQQIRQVAGTTLGDAKRVALFAASSMARAAAARPKKAAVAEDSAPEETAEAAAAE